MPAVVADGLRPPLPPAVVAALRTVGGIPLPPPPLLPPPPPPDAAAEPAYSEGPLAAVVRAGAVWCSTPAADPVDPALVADANRPDAVAGLEPPDKGRKVVALDSGSLMSSMTESRRD